MDQGQAKAFVDPFVKRNWRTLAAAAWRGYVGHGRGALTIDWAAVRRWVDGATADGTPCYAGDSGLPQVRELVERYDPQRSIVIAFIEDDGAVHTWVFSYSPSPPQAHERSVR
jgi:hypothetical protein